MITKSANLKRMAALLGAAAMLPPPASAGTLSTIYSFRNAADSGGSAIGLTLVGGNLYRVVTNGASPTFFGAICRINIASGRESTLYKFTGGADGSDPEGALIYVGGTLYGTTYSGGANDLGTVFSFKPSTATLSTLYSFRNGWRTSSLPAGALTYAAGTLFGSTVSGGPNGVGTVYSLTPAGVETTLWGFSDRVGGFYPNGGLVYDAGMLYGTTAGFVDSSIGNSVFAVDVATKAETLLYGFTGASDGAYPAGGLVRVGGSLWGTTHDGGSSYCGTVYKIDIATHAETIVHNFTCQADGGYPPAGLVNVSGTLYGSSNGTLFSVSPVSGAFATVYKFTGGSDGAEPSSQLINSAGTLYGTTSEGGRGYGTVFKFVP